MELTIEIVAVRPPPKGCRQVQGLVPKEARDQCDPTSVLVLVRLYVVQPAAGVADTVQVRHPRLL